MVEQLSLLTPPFDLQLSDGNVVLTRGFFGSDEAAALLAAIEASTRWRHDTIWMYGREFPVPRLSAWHGEAGRTYTYSRIAMHPRPWTAPLLAIKDRVEGACGVAFNSVLVNLYRDGRDGVAWHSDDERELGGEPVIASVSFGATRKFHLRHRTDRSEPARHLELAHGDLLVMRGATQRNWEHQVPKTARPVGRRINLTFRSIVAGSVAGE